MNEVPGVAPGPADGLAEALGLDAPAMGGAEVRLVVAGDAAAPALAVEATLVDGETHRAPVPDRFVDAGPTVDLGGLAEWAGVDAIVLPVRAPLRWATDLAGEHDPTGGRWTVERPGEYAEPRVTHLALGRRPGGEAEPMMAGALTPPPSPDRDDPDSWPDTLDEWLADIDARLAWDPRTTAPMLRALYGGIDGSDGWDPATDVIDPTMEEALRIRQVPGALPPPEPLPSARAAAAPADGGDGEDLPVVPIDNRVAIEAEPALDQRGGCLRALWVRLVLGAGLALAVVLLALWTFGGGSSDDEPAAPPATAAPSAADRLAEATQALLDARTAEVEQTLTVRSPAGESTVSAAGVVDLGAGDAQTTISADGRSFAAYLDEMTYAFLAGDGWVGAEPGELNEDPDAAAAGLAGLGIGETLSPLAMAYLAAAAEPTGDAQGSDGATEGVTTLPVTGPGAVHVDNWARSVWGRGQDGLSGLGLRLRIEPRVGDDVTISLTIELEEAIDLLDDDPQAEALRGITLSTMTHYRALGEGVTLDGRNAERTPLGDYLRQF